MNLRGFISRNVRFDRIYFKPQACQLKSPDKKKKKKGFKNVNCESSNTYLELQVYFSFDIKD